jgi:hypothetical protein
MAADGIKKKPALGRPSYIEEWLTERIFYAFFQGRGKKGWALFAL